MRGGFGCRGGGGRTVILFYFFWLLEVLNFGVGVRWGSGFCFETTKSLVEF